MGAHFTRRNNDKAPQVQEAVFRVAVEAVFPQCAISQLEDKQVEENRDLLSRLRDGSLYDGDGKGSEWCGMLITGSRAEGLAIEWAWGHPEADRDYMSLNGGPLGVHVPQGRHPPGRATLRYKPEGCPVAYCKLEVSDVQALTGVKKGRWGEPLGTGCVHRCEGAAWLHTQNTLKRIQHGMSINISGPAGQSGSGMLNEFIPTLVCSDAHPDMGRRYVRRPRNSWPSPHQLKFIKQFPMLLVLTGHKLSHREEIPLQARLSWSPSEMALIMELADNIKQEYIAVKCVFKHSMKHFRGTARAGDGRSHVGSFHLKIVFLRYLERRPPTEIRSQSDLMLGLLHNLDNCLVAGELPHYFLPDCNLLATVGPEERRIARNAIQHILSDPLRAILTCPTEPEVIFGNVQPDALLTVFQQMSSHPTCARSREDLLQLLDRLDETRRERYLRQREKDERIGVSGRTELTGLVDMLREQIQKCLL